MDDITEFDVDALKESKERLIEILNKDEFNDEDYYMFKFYSECFMKCMD